MNRKPWHDPIPHEFNYPVAQIKAEIEAQRLIRTVNVSAGVFRAATSTAARATAQPFCAA
jgi:hypothetical protein